MRYGVKVHASQRTADEAFALDGTPFEPAPKPTRKQLEEERVDLLERDRHLYRKGERCSSCGN